MRVWNCPVLPVMPWVMTLVFLLIRMLIARSSDGCIPSLRRRPASNSATTLCCRPGAGRGPIPPHRIQIAPADAGVQLTRTLGTSFPRKRESMLEDFVIYVVPIRVRFLDQLHLPQPIPFFDLLLASDRRFCVLVGLEPNKPGETVFSCESFNQLLTVLRNALRG